MFSWRSKEAAVAAEAAEPPELWAAPRRALFQAQANVDPVDDADDDGLPGNQVPEPVEQLPVQDVRPLPPGGWIKEQNGWSFILSGRGLAWTEDTGCSSSSAGQPSRCSKDTSASCPRCTSRGCRTRGTCGAVQEKPVHKTAARGQRLRIRVSTGQLDGVLDEALLLQVHQDLLPADGAGVPGQTPAGDPSLTAELNRPTALALAAR